MDGACCSSTVFVKAQRVPCFALLVCIRKSWLPSLCAALLPVAYHCCIKPDVLTVAAAATAAAAAARLRASARSWTACTMTACLSSGSARRR